MTLLKKGGLFGFLLEVAYGLLIAVRNVLSLSHTPLFFLIEAYDSHQSCKGRFNFKVLFRH